VSEFGVCTALDDIKSKIVYGCTIGKGVSTYIAKAEALIQLLEIHDCGSVGGFDPESGGDSLHGLLYLEQRFEALKRKNAPKKTKKKNGTVADK
jgi:hypothetical protein